MTTAKERKKLQLQRAKAIAAVQATHAALLAVEAGPFPTANHRAAFGRWSDAMRTAVALALWGQPSWNFETWRWCDLRSMFDGLVRGVAYLADGLPMRLEVPIFINPKLPIEQEMQRLEVEMAFYRDAVETMEIAMERKACQKSELADVKKV
jgi:hypothetical protein